MYAALLSPIRENRGLPARLGRRTACCSYTMGPLFLFLAAIFPEIE